MKKIKILFVAFIVTFVSCESVLDKQPLDTVSDAVVWKDINLINAYLNDLYYRTDFLNNTGESGLNEGLIAAMGGEARAFGGWQEPYTSSTGIINETGTPGTLDYWKYENIRDANYFIEQMQTVAEISQEQIDQKVSEARFLRAYMYFEMVKRYGGVPILTTVQAIDTPKEELYVSRNTEQEVYDFILAEMDDIILILPTEYDSKSTGRPTQWAALALKSRAALYAASIANFGQVQLDGVIGIPNGEAQTYYQIAYDASKAIMTSGYHALYDVESDKAKNFGQLFIDESAANTEVIFAERYDYGLNYGHSLNYLAMPAGFSKEWDSNFNYFYDFVELFEFEDGRSGNSISREELVNNQWSAEELFHSRDPRFRASIFYPESPWQGSTVYFHSGTYSNGELVSSGTLEGGWPAAAPNRNRVRTGFHLRKRLDESHVLPLNGEDDTDYIVFRLGEIYLNLAEAAFYLGKTGEALDALNSIRERAGMSEKDEITEKNLRNERQVELTFEDHRYWDLRRWRIAKEVLDGVRLQGLQYFYHMDTHKYSIVLVNGEHTSRVFQDRNYYLPLGIGRVSDNPNLVENPGYNE